MIYKILGSIALILAVMLVGAWHFHTTVSVERTFNASEADVWRVWTDADSIQKWWGPKGYTALVARNDVRERGSYLWAMKSEQGKVFWNTGTYRKSSQTRKSCPRCHSLTRTEKQFPARKYRFPGIGPRRSPYR